MKRRRSCMILIAAGVLVCIAGIVIFSSLRSPLYVLQMYGMSLLRGQQVVMLTPSPDGAFEAYAVESPSIDPPNQTLYIDRKDGHRFVMVAHLVEDVDQLHQIFWSPGSEIVVFVTSNNLFAVLLPTYQMVKIPLDSEFYRYEAGRFTTFGGGIPKWKVEAVNFPEPGSFSYQLSGGKLDRTVRLKALLSEAP